MFLCFNKARKITLKLVTVFFFWVAAKDDNILIFNNFQITFLFPAWSRTFTSSLLGLEASIDLVDNHFTDWQFPWFIKTKRN